MGDRLPGVLFSNPPPPPPQTKKNRLDREFQKPGFRFDLKNPLEVWILWIYDPFLDLRKKTQNLFLGSRIGIWILPNKRNL